MTVIFFREGMFYPVELLEPADLPPGCDRQQDIAEHVRLNPGTLRVEDTAGNVLWQPTAH